MKSRTKIESDIAAMLDQAATLETSLQWFGSPMAGGMLKHSPIVAECLRSELQRCRTRIRNAQQMLMVAVQRSDANPDTPTD